MLITAREGGYLNNWIVVLVGWSVCCLAGWCVVWLVGMLSGLLVGVLGGQYVGWSMCRLMFYLFVYIVLYFKEQSDVVDNELYQDLSRRNKSLQRQLLEVKKVYLPNINNFLLFILIHYHSNNNNEIFFYLKENMELQFSFEEAKKENPRLKVFVLFEHFPNFLQWASCPGLK